MRALQQDLRRVRDGVRVRVRVRVKVRVGVMVGGAHARGCRPGRACSAERESFLASPALMTW